VPPAQRRRSAADSAHLGVAGRGVVSGEGPLWGLTAHLGVVGVADADDGAAIQNGDPEVFASRMHNRAVVHIEAW